MIDYLVLFPHFRRYAALYISKHMFSLDDEVDEIVGHSYLFLKEQLEISKMPPPSGILHGTIIGALYTTLNRICYCMLRNISFV